MDYKKLNKYLGNLNTIRSSYSRKSLEGVELIDQETINEIVDEDGSEGEYGLSFEVYKLPFDNLHVRLKITTDSYGNNEQVTGIEFVTPIQKTVTKFEAIK